MEHILSISFGVCSLVLLCFVVSQQIFFMRHIQKLVDKVMSKDFQHYQSAQKKDERVKVQVSEEAPEDMRVMHEFRM